MNDTGHNPNLKAITATVVAPQQATDAIPLTLHAGDRVHVGEPHPERPGYAWVEDGQISAGWVPVDLLTSVGGPSGPIPPTSVSPGTFTTATAEYCSAELTVEPGDTVRLMWEDPAHGAWWCEDRHSERGWVRSDCLRMDDAAG